ncbi:hypothetical protein [Novosphingobium aquimarinum]|uniref:hypothetical protein n=1 Tax=Novosphingobium aquimarinum TaxID=2682494 RepID=UPI0012EBADFB|nr:hypothetical protein [Novosphingobium aquimarinum]
MRVDLLDFEVESRGETLWTGVASVSRMASAFYSMKAEEASGSECPLKIGTKRNSYKLALNIRKAGGNANDPDTYSFEATIERLDLKEDCKTLVRSISSASRQYVRMRRRQSIEFSGADDFQVVVTRR